MPAFQGEGDVHAKLQRAIRDNAVVMISRTTCGFCHEAKRTLRARGVTGLFVDTDTASDGHEVGKAVAAMAGRTGAPQLWIGGEHVGGCDDLKALEASGGLDVLLNRAGVHAGEAGVDVEAAGQRAASLFPGPEAAFGPLFHFPSSVDKRVSRPNGALVFAVCVFAAAFAEQEATPWVVIGLFVDFALGFFGGAAMSPTGVLASVPFTGTQPDLQPGVSKQLAALLGAVFSGAAAAALLAGSPLGGRVLLGILAGCAALEVFVGFCVASYTFGILIDVGIVRPSVYRLHIHTKAESSYAWAKPSARAGKRTTPPKAVAYPRPGVPPNPTDLRFKPRDEADKRQQFHPVKYCHVAYFMVPLSVAGLGLPWRTVAQATGTGAAVWHVLGCTGGVLFAGLLGLFLAKCVIYPTKAWKEWEHPHRGPAFATVPMTALILASLANSWALEAAGGDDFQWRKDVAKGLYWAGSAVLMLMTVLQVSSWLSTHRSEEGLAPLWLLIPCGNLVGAIAARPLDDGYVEWGWFQFSVAAVLWLPLFPASFNKALTAHHSDFRTRPSYFIWMAPTGLAMMAYASLQGLETLDILQRVLFFCSLGIYLVLLACVWPRDFFLEGTFDMSAWGFVFPTNVLAAAAARYYSLTGYGVAQVLYMVILAAASTSCAIALLATLAALRTKRLFTPVEKWSPLSFIKITHNAFREEVPRLEKLAAAMEPAIAQACTVEAFAAGWRAMVEVHDLHSFHEDAVIFKALEEHFPGQTCTASHEHSDQETKLRAIKDTLAALAASASEKERGSLIEEVTRDVRAVEEKLIEHLDGEDRCFCGPVARKYLSVTTAKMLTRHVWDATPPDKMGPYLAWVLGSLRLHHQKVRFLKTWMWAMPERCQLVGLAVYRHVDDVTWVQLSAVLPEMIPRGLPGWKRYY